MTFARRSLMMLAGGLLAAALGACRAPKGGDRAPNTTRDTLAGARKAAAEHDSLPREQPLAAADTATIARSTDTSVTNAKPGTQRIASLDPLADSISDRMVFLALTQTTFLAATRGKRLLLDLGRFDGTLAGSKQKKAFEEAAKVLSPVHVGDRFGLRGPWGADSATVTGFAVWNGRIVATLEVEPAVDSLAKSGATLVALATRYVAPLVPDTSAPKRDTAPPKLAPIPKPVPRTDSIVGTDTVAVVAPVPGCNRDSVEETLVLRIAELADSLALVLEADTAKLTDRLKKTVKTQRSQAVGCFGKWRVMLFVNQSAGDYEYVHEIALLVDTAGVAAPLTVRDLRFKAHEAIRAFDVDGDEVDDIAVKGRGNRIGGTVILRFDPVRKRLEYVMGGFAWEVF